MTAINRIQLRDMAGVWHVVQPGSGFSLSRFSYISVDLSTAQGSFSTRVNLQMDKIYWTQNFPQTPGTVSIDLSLVKDQPSWVDVYVDDASGGPPARARFYLFE